jgi:hypothetical protein
VQRSPALEEALGTVLVVVVETALVVLIFSVLQSESVVVVLPGSFVMAIDLAPAFSTTLALMSVQTVAVLPSL